MRFRAGEEWSELAKGRQSGGEMSVTTAVYMLALQVGGVKKRKITYLFSQSFIGADNCALSMC